DGTIGEVHREVRALFDSGGRIADDVLEAVGAHLVEHAPYPFLRQRIPVARLRRSAHDQRLDARVLDQRLLERAFALDDVDEVVHHAPFAPHDEVEIAQADVEVDHGDAMPPPGQTAGQAGRGGRLADAPLAGSDNDDLGQIWIS